MLGRTTHESVVRNISPASKAAPKHKEGANFNTLRSQMLNDYMITLNDYMITLNDYMIKLNDYMITLNDYIQPH